MYVGSPVQRQNADGGGWMQEKRSKEERDQSRENKNGI
jgi:hypothetical protein